MNIKNNKGITLTILIITIMLMFILFGITFSSATTLLKNSQKNKMRTMLYMVQSRAQILLDEYLFENDGKDLNTISDDIIKNSLKGTYLGASSSEITNVGFSETPAKDTIIYCSWNGETLRAQGIDTKNLADGDTIIIQYDIKNEEVEVASVKGFSDGKDSIHKLKEFKDS